MRKRHRWLSEEVVLRATSSGGVTKVWKLKSKLSKESLVNCLGKWMDIFLKGEVEMLTVASCSVLSDRKGWRRCDFMSTLVLSSNPT